MPCRCRAAGDTRPARTDSPRGPAAHRGACLVHTRCAAGHHRLRGDTPRRRACAERGVVTHLSGPIRLASAAHPGRSDQGRRETCDLEEAPPMTDDLTGRTLRGGEYQLRELLARGGQATVYRAYARQLETDVAVKVLNPTLA